MEIHVITTHRAGPIQPLAKPGENIAVWSASAWHYYQIERLEPILPSNAIVHNLGAVAAGAVINPTLATTLEFDTNRLAQLRMAVLDDIQVRVSQPQAAAKFVNVDAHTEVTLFTHWRDPDAALTEFFVFEDKQPLFRIENPTDYALAQARIVFWGFQYLLNPLAKVPERATFVLGAGLAG